jgi:transcriptional regulator with XRE-family HTH domain
MTTISEERTRVTRPGAGVAVDPQRVLIARQKLFLRRWQLSDKIRDLGMTGSHGEPVTLGPDFLGKIESGKRKPSLDSFAALCAALDCEPDDLMPSGRSVTLPRSLRERKARLDHNGDLRDFAIPRGLRYKNPETGRVYYRKELREAYARHLALLTARESGDATSVRQAELAYESALARVPRVNEVADLESPGQDLLAS